MSIQKVTYVEVDILEEEALVEVELKYQFRIPLGTLRGGGHLTGGGGGATI
jgi:hypothetical protein